MVGRRQRLSGSRSSPDWLTVFPLEIGYEVLWLDPPYVVIRDCNFRQAGSLSYLRNQSAMFRRRLLATMARVRRLILQKTARLRPTAGSC